jgi:hypothetical protein
MSSINGTLYFAPHVRFADLALASSKLADQFYERINGFYLEPAEVLAERRHDFAAGLLAVCAADVLGDFMTGAATNARIVGFFKRIDGLNGDGMAELFVDHFRNGLVHEGRIKKGGMFLIEDMNLVAVKHGASLAVNPVLLGRAVKKREAPAGNLTPDESDVSEC